MTTEEALAAVVKMLQDGVEAAGPLAQEVLRQYQWREGFLGVASGLGALVAGIVAYRTLSRLAVAVRDDDPAKGIPATILVILGGFAFIPLTTGAVQHLARCLAPLPYILGM